MKNFRRILASLMVAVMLVTAAPLSGFVGLEVNLDWLNFTTKASAATYNGTCGDNLTWTLDTETGELVISGTGDMYDYDYDVPWYDYIDYIDSVTIADGVTSIGSGAFSDCTGLTSVTIGNGVETIYDYAFCNCTGLTSVTIGNGVETIYDYAFCNCTGLTSITIPDSVTSIGSGAFLGCTGLTSITIPDSVTSIGEGAFYYCTGLTSVTIPDGVTSIGSYAFSDCTGLTSVTIPDGVTSIGSYAFSDCTGLTSVTIPDSVTSIGSYAFSDCTGLTSIAIPDSVTSIGACAFSWCASLKNLTIGNGVATIGNNAFAYSKTLTDLYFNATNCDAVNEAFHGCSSLTNVVIGEDVTKVPPNFITNCDAVVDIVIPESVTEIGDFAFINNDVLETVRFNRIDEIAIGNDIFQSSYKAMICCKENSYMHSYAMMNGIKFAIMDGNDSPKFEIKNDVLISYKGDAENVFVSAASRIGYGAFKGNVTLKSVELSSGVDRIFGNAFADCTKLERIIIPKSVASIGDGAFKGCNNLTIWCYAGSYAESYAISNGIPVEYITLKIDKSVVILNPDETTSVVALFNTTILDEIDIVWSSSNPEVATVNSDGVVTALKSGETTITATSSTGLSASCDVRVTEPGSKVHGVALGFNVTLNKGDEITVHPNIDADEGVLYTVEYLSSDKSVATVDEDGKIMAVSAGMTTITCVVTDEHGNTVEASIVVVVNNSADSFELSDDEIYISIGSERQLTGIINPSTDANKEIVWESSNPLVATVDENGNVKGLKAGVTVIIATTQEGGLKDFCLVKVVGVEAVSSASIDHEKGVITGLSSNTTSLDGFIELSDPTCSLNYDSLGTDSIVYIERDGEVVDAYTVVIFGDVNGDGWYDGTDSIIVSCLANGLLTKDNVSEAVYMAADCNHDGTIDALDVAILEQAGALLASVDQSKSNDELVTDEAYVEYLDLIDQTPDVDEEIPETEEPEEGSVDVNISEQGAEAMSVIEMIINFIKSIIEMLLSFIPVPYK